MTPPAEGMFRVVFGIVLTLSLAIRVYFQRQTRGFAKVDVRHERRERRFYNLVFCSYLLMFVYVVSPWLDFAHFPLPVWVRWLGGGLMTASLGLFWWTHRTLGLNWSGVLAIRQEHVLVTHGPYRRVRHPMYTAFFVSGIGILLLSANWFIAAVNLGAVTWMYLVRVPAEEAMMLEHFGEAYRQYMTRAGRLMPRLR